VFPRRSSQPPKNDDDRAVGILGGRAGQRSGSVIGCLIERLIPDDSHFRLVLRAPTRAPIAAPNGRPRNGPVIKHQFPCSPMQRVKTSTVPASPPHTAPPRVTHLADGASPVRSAQECDSPSRYATWQFGQIGKPCSVDDYPECARPTVLAPLKRTEDHRSGTLHRTAADVIRLPASCAAMSRSAGDAELPLPFFGCCGEENLREAVHDFL
jgi:hypothetical protein